MRNILARFLTRVPEQERSPRGCYELDQFSPKFITPSSLSSG